MHEKACDRDGQSGSSGATDVSGKAEAAVRSAETNKWTGQDGIHVDFVTPIGMNTEISATGAHNLISVTLPSQMISSASARWHILGCHWSTNGSD